MQYWGREDDCRDGSTEALAEDPRSVPAPVQGSPQPLVTLASRAPMSSPGVCISSLPGAQADPPQPGAERGKNLQVHCPRTLVETTMEKEGLCCPGWSPRRKMLPVRSSWNPFHQSLLLGRLRPHRRSQCEESSLPASRDGDDNITKGRNLGPQSADGRDLLHTASDSLPSTKTSGECCDSWGY